MLAIPVRLRKEPLLEAVWEARFSDSDPAVGDLLPGLLARAYGPETPKVVRLPVADIPVAATEADAALRYLPRIRLEGRNRSIQIGNRVLSLSYRRPYPGWVCFSQSIRDLVKAARETRLVHALERFSLKYIDLIELEEPRGLGCLDLQLCVAGTEILEEPVQTRVELADRDMLHIVQVSSPVEAVLPDSPQRLRGVLVDIDTIRQLRPGGAWEEVEASLEEVHSACKKMFFRLLKPETLQHLEPEYGG